MSLPSLDDSPGGHPANNSSSMELTRFFKKVSSLSTSGPTRNLVASAPHDDEQLKNVVAMIGGDVTVKHNRVAAGQLIQFLQLQQKGTDGTIFGISKKDLINAYTKGFGDRFLFGNSTNTNQSIKAMSCAVLASNWIDQAICSNLLKPVHVDFLHLSQSQSSTQLPAPMNKVIDPRSGQVVLSQRKNDLSGLHWVGNYVLGGGTCLSSLFRDEEGVEYVVTVFRDDERLMALFRGKGGEDGWIDFVIGDGVVSCFLEWLRVVIDWAGVLLGLDGIVVMCELASACECVRNAFRAVERKKDR